MMNATATATVTVVVDATMDMIIIVVFFFDDSRSPDCDRSAGQDRRGANGDGGRAGRRAFLFNG